MNGDDLCPTLAIRMPTTLRGLPFKLVNGGAWSLHLIGVKHLVCGHVQAISSPHTHATPKGLLHLLVDLTVLLVLLLLLFTWPCLASDPPGLELIDVKH